MNTRRPDTNNKIGSEFVLIVAGILFIMLIANALFQYRIEQKQAAEDLDLYSRSIGNLLTSISIAPLLVYDNLTLNEYMENAASQKDVLFTVIFDPGGHPLTSYLDESIPAVRNAIDQSDGEDIQAVIQTLTQSGDVSISTYPVEFNGRHLADIRIGIDPGSIEAAPLKHLIVQLITSVLFAIFVGLAIYIGFIYKVTRPVNKLIDAARDVAAFRFDREVASSGNNELSELAETFNTMRHELRQAVDEREKTMIELEQFNASLEERVSERTMELQTLNTEIAHQAMHDPLTGLPNRLLVVERLNQSIRLAKRNNSRLAVFILDLNNFKEINDTLGHPEGDIILQQVAVRIPEALRESDTIGRLGGDEFAVVLPDIEMDQARNVAQKILNILLPSFELQGQPIAISASIGIAVYPDHGQDQAVLIRRADVAMYEAKRNDEGMMVYSPEFDLYSPKRLALMADLRHAIEQNELELFYQPQISLTDGQVNCVEALLRWNHAEHGMIQPEQFIHMAENSGLINSLSDWVLNRAMMQWNEWSSDGLNIMIAVNLSARNLLDPELPDRISEMRNRHRMPGQFLKLEITENAIMHNTATVMSIMTHPKLAELRFSIDDFGTGYSSLSYLKRLKVQEVKIDKAFVSEMHTREDDASIVRSVIDLAHNLGHSVVAEGIDSEASLRLLREMGCDYGQGYYFAKPAAPGDIPRILATIHKSRPVAARR